MGRRDGGGPWPLAEYKVIYRGGLAELPKPKSAAIELTFWPDRLILEPTNASRKWWTPMTISYAMIDEFSIAKRQVSSTEGFLTAGRGGGSRDIATNNNVHIGSTMEGGRQVLLRLEMLTGFTVFAQARKCAEMMDMLRVNGIMLGSPPHQGAVPAPEQTSVADELAKLGALHASGVLNDEEFAAAKSQLLAS